MSSPACGGSRGRSDGCRRMVDDKYCIDILTQLNSAAAALEAVAWACSTSTFAIA